jgi:Flp pilus assembly protein TadD
MSSGRAERNARQPGNHRQLVALLASVVLGGLFLSVSGCTTFFAGKSAFGDNALVSADLPPIPTDTAAGDIENGKNHFRNGDYGYAAAYYKQAVDLSPGSAEAYFGLAASYDQLRRFDLSDRVYATLLTLTGPSAQYYNNLGYSYLQRGDNRRALANFQRARALDPANETVASNIDMLTGTTNSSAEPAQ